jgi:hypothetical protein
VDEDVALEGVRRAWVFGGYILFGGRALEAGSMVRVGDDCWCGLYRAGDGGLIFDKVGV